MHRTLRRTWNVHFSFFNARNRPGGQAPQRRTLRAEALEPRWCPALDVPALSSLPGADHTIYLDFNGHVTENTNWNNYFNNPSVRSPAYNTDSDPNSYSTSERADIETACSSRLGHPPRKLCNEWTK